MSSEKVSVRWICDFGVVREVHWACDGETFQRAKEFLVAQITEEAQRQGVPLSDIERKMLYFSETGWTLPDIWDVSDEFDRDYDQGEYEKKIAGLVRSADKRLRENPSDYEAWRNAIETLRKEDHYLLVMVDRSPPTKGAGLRPQGDQLRLLGTALAIVVLLVAGLFAHDAIRDKYGIDLSKYLSFEKIFVSLWAVAASAVAVYYLVRWTFGTAAATKLLDKALSVFERAERKET